MLNLSIAGDNTTVMETTTFDQEERKNQTIDKSLAAGDDAGGVGLGLA